MWFGVMGPARLKLWTPSKVSILGYLCSHSPKHARATTIIHCILFRPDGAGANDISILQSTPFDSPAEVVYPSRSSGRVEYFVKWRGYPDSENAWERKTDINPDLVAAFEANANERG